MSIRPSRAISVGSGRDILQGNLSDGGPLNGVEGLAQCDPTHGSKTSNITTNELTLEYGSLTIRALREVYGSFAPHCADSKKLSDVLADLDPAALTQLVRDYKSG